MGLIPLEIEETLHKGGGGGDTTQRRRRRRHYTRKMT
jgi:hypothetical protein